MIGSGTFDGRNGYILRGSFTLSEDAATGRIRLATSEDFFFGTEDGAGTPAPGFALFQGDPTGRPRDEVEPIARATDFLRIADSQVSVSGPQTGLLPQGPPPLTEDSTLFLWCFFAPVLLGVGPITLEAPGNGN